jgi:hypothetical protein
MSTVIDVVLKNTGHWVLEENPKGTTDALMNFCDIRRSVQGAGRDNFDQNLQ